jgi:GNAT superfamily N-acetyltransferase
MPLTDVKREVDVKMPAPKDPPIRLLYETDVVLAMELVWRVFSEFEAPEYSDEGIAEFKAFIEPSFISKKIESGEFTLWGAFSDDKIVGVIATKPPSHISLLFVDKEHQRRGIARRLLEAAISALHNSKRVTVHSSPYAVEIYRRLGFNATNNEQTINGLRFIPMEYSL